MPHLDRDGDVFVLDLGDGENRFNAGLVASLNECLDEVEATPAPRAMVTTASGKFWSNGFDLEWVVANLDAIDEFRIATHELYARFLGLGVPNCAAIQGHVIGGGVLLAVAHDHSVMRADRGFLALPEVDLRIPFTSGYSALVRARLPIRIAHELMTTGRRFGGAEAVAAGIIDEAVPKDALLETAIERVTPLAGKDPATFATIKQRLYAEAIKSLRDHGRNRYDIPGSESASI
jgi:enoyl-CoA hydratase/carnithine racemase